jgi:hypothetical protein
VLKDLKVRDYRLSLEVGHGIDLGLRVRNHDPSLGYELTSNVTFGGSPMDMGSLAIN